MRGDQALAVKTHKPIRAHEQRQVFFFFAPRAALPIATEPQYKSEPRAHVSGVLFGCFF